MADLDTIRDDLEARIAAIDGELGQYDALVDERARLRAAVAALKAPRATAPPAPREGAARAQRGANREAILGVIGERPGVSSGEVASVTGIAPTTVRSTITALKRAGVVVSDPGTGGLQLV